MKKYNIVLFGICMVFFSCTQENLEVFSQNSFFNLQPQTKSLDYALLSDPFFATLFNSTTNSNFEKFYSQAWQKALDAELFVVADEPLLTQIQQGGQELQAISSLPSWDYYKIIRAKRLLVSPLFSYFNPELMSTIITGRGDLELEIFSYAPQNREENKMYIENSYALRELASTVAERFQEQTELNELIIFADSSNAEKSIADLEVFLRTLYRFSVRVKTTVHWEERKSGLENITRQSIRNTDVKTALVVLHVGLHTYATLNYIHKELSGSLEDRVFVIHKHWKNNEFDYKRSPIVRATIGARPDDIFTQKNFIYSQMYRYK